MSSGEEEQLSRERAEEFLETIKDNLEKPYIENLRKEIDKREKIESDKDQIQIERDQIESEKEEAQKN